MNESIETEVVIEECVYISINNRRGIIIWMISIALKVLFRFMISDCEDWGLRWLLKSMLSMIVYVHVHVHVLVRVDVHAHVDVDDDNDNDVNNDDCDGDDDCDADCFEDEDRILRWLQRGPLEGDDDDCDADDNNDDNKGAKDDSLSPYVSSISIVINVFCADWFDRLKPVSTR